LRPVNDPGPRAPTVSYARTALSVALLAVLYLWVFPFHDVVRNPNENVRVYMTVAIVDDHTFAINRIEGAWGYVNDKAVRLGRLYSSKAPGTSYLGVPVYWALTRLTHQDSHVVAPAAAGPPGRRRAPPREPINRARVMYILRLFSTVFPGLLFGWFWHRFLAARTSSTTLRESIFFSTMAGSSLYAYSLVFVSHAQNAFCFGAALMALTIVRERDDADAIVGRAPGVRFGWLYLAGLFGAGATLFEYPAAIASAAVALWIAAVAAERRRPALVVALVALGVAAGLALKHHPKPAALAALAAAVAYLVTLSPRGVARLVAAALGGAIPTGLVLFYHHRAFGDAFKPGYSFLENSTFREEINQGFFGATTFSWEAALRLWLDPAFGLVPCTPILLLALIGLGATLAPDLPDDPRVLSRRNVLGAAFLAAALVAAAKVALVLKDHARPDLHARLGPWVAALAVALVALAAARCPRPPRTDRAMGAVVALTLVGMTHLIGMMNNWRGGWQVGPRYLVTVVPALALLALAGGESLLIAARRRDHAGLRVGVTAFAAGATVAAMLITGTQSAWFPHVPVEYASPFFEMMVPLIRDGFVPHNVGLELGAHGLRSMAPYFAAAAVIAVLVARGDRRRPLVMLAHALGAAAVTLLMLLPSALAYRPESAAVTRYVKSAFEPHPADTATPQAPPRETASQAAGRARRLAESGQTQAALDAWLHAIRDAR
jgi:hypothetical protein